MRDSNYIIPIKFPRNVCNLEKGNSKIKRNEKKLYWKGVKKERHRSIKIDSFTSDFGFPIPKKYWKIFDSSFLFDKYYQVPAL